MAEKQGIDFASCARTAVRVVARPAAFFREMARTGGYLEPMAFVLVMAVATALVDSVLALLGLKFILSVGMAVARIMIYPFIILLGSFIWAAVVFIVWKLAGSREPYETAYRCVAYLSALMPVLTIVETIPAAGPFLVIAAWVYYYVAASVEVHKVPAKQAWLVFGIFGAALYVLLLMTGAGTYTPQRIREERMINDMQKKLEENQKRLEELRKRMEKK
jgi:hypothetical protein